MFRLDVIRAHNAILTFAQLSSFVEIILDRIQRRINNSRGAVRLIRCGLPPRRRQFYLTLRMPESVYCRRADGLANVTAREPETRTGRGGGRFVRSAQNQRGISPSIALTLAFATAGGKVSPSPTRNGIFLEILFKSFRTEILRPFSYGSSLR